MKQKSIIIFLLILSLKIPFSFSFELKKIFSIGSEVSNYNFSLISDVDIDNDGNIYISDLKGCFLRKYSKNGEFIKETGQCGQGPGDFSQGIEINFYNDNIYGLDQRNYRICIYDKELNLLRVTKISRHISDEFFIVDGLFYSVVTPFISGNENSILAYNDKGKTKFNFFNHTITFINNKEKNRITRALQVPFYILKMDYNKENKEFVITFHLPEKLVNLYFYDIKGNFLRMNSLNLIKNYKPPKFFLEYPRKYPSKSKTIYIDAVFFYKTNYIVLNYLVEFRSGQEVKSRDSYLLLIKNDSGNIIEKKKIDSNIKILNIKNDLVFAKNFNSDIEAVDIYQLDFNNLK